MKHSREREKEKAKLGKRGPGESRTPAVNLAVQERNVE
jgi:hypothetical protein